MTEPSCSVGLLWFVEERRLIRQHRICASLDEFAERRVIVHGPREQREPLLLGHRDLSEDQIG